MASGFQQDSVQPASQQLLDSVVVKSPLPDPLVPIVQWLFQRPGWFMISGLVVGGLVVVALLVWVWKHRKELLHWLATRDRGVKLAMAGSLAAVFLLVAGTGFKAYHYMMHDNDFCRGCHVFVPSGKAFVRPDTGTYLLVNALEGKHDTLQCHACHAFDIKAQTKELILWMVARPEKVPNHEKVPRNVCEKCHVQGAAKATWQAIAKTAGHRAHLESDSLPLKHVECLTCHARSAHRFVPADTTCAQKGCHLTDEVKIRLGKMADQATIHCAVCHKFTKEVPLLATRDSAAGALRPAQRQCFSCHAMRQRLQEFDSSKDPHSGTCGMCHNPHAQVKPADALKSCTDAKCHADWRKQPFHVGKAHKNMVERCIVCHQPHAARVDPSDCEGCHERVRAKGQFMKGHQPPLPFDTLKALRNTSIDPSLLRHGPPGGKGDSPPEDDPPAALLGAVPAQQQQPDTFPHDRHRRLACLTCHFSKSGHGGLTFKPPRGCQICHHQTSDTLKCEKCHDAEQMREKAVTATISVKASGKEDAPRRTREVSFSHEVHTKEKKCTDCHVTSVTMEPKAETKDCTGCHEDHHTADRACANCHRSDTILSGHKRESHVQCDACHAEKTVTRFTPTRSFCLACHPTTVDHHEEKQCTQCHMLTSPENYRAKLIGASKP
jgi:hypothetical protein